MTALALFTSYVGIPTALTVTLSPVRYVKGTQVRLGVVVESGAQNVDPDTVIVRVRAPEGDVVDTPAVKDDVGVYHLDVDADTAGAWRWEVVTTGDYQAADIGQFYVEDAFA